MPLSSIEASEIYSEKYIPSWYAQSYCIPWIIPNAKWLTGKRALGGKSNKDFIVYFFQTWPWRLCFPGLITSAESVCQYWILLLRCFSRSPCLLIPTNCKTMVTWKISQKHPSPSSWQNCDGERWKLTNRDSVSSELFKVTCKPLLIWSTRLFDKLLHVTWLA